MITRSSIHRAHRALVAGALLVVVSACQRPSGTGAAPAPDGKPYPVTIADAEAMKARGVSWSDGEVRNHYQRLVATIGEADAGWRAAGVAAGERARRAYERRHTARLVARAMMSDARMVEALRARDEVKYGHPDGPRFDDLVARQREKGKTGDAVYEAIVESAQRTNTAVDLVVGGN